MSAGRSNRADVRNPVLGLASAAGLDQVDAGALRALAAVLRGIKADAADRAEKAWRKHKAPMAAYWKAVSVYAGHIARAVDQAAERSAERAPGRLL